MKILSLFLVSLFFASSFQFSPEYIKESRIRDARALDLANALISVVDQLIQTVSGALNNFLMTVGNLVLSGINNIEKAIREAIDDFLLKLLEAQLEIEKLIGEDIIGCFGNLEEDFQRIKSKTVEGITTCYNDGKDDLTSISIDIFNYGNTNNEIISNVKTTIESCLVKPSFGEKLTCVVEATSVIRDALFNLLKNIDDTAETIKSKIENSVIGTYGCINTALEGGEEEISDILEGTKDCIASYRKTSVEPENPPTSTEETPVELENPPTSSEETPVELENPTTSTEETPVEPENPPTSSEKTPVESENPTTEEPPVKPQSRTE